MKTQTQASRADMLLNQPVKRVIPRLAIPTIISMLITSIYNMADTFFVSQISTAASGAVGVTFSAMALIQALAFTIGMGCSTNMSRALGRGDTEEARRFVSLAFFTALGVGMVISVLGVSLIGPIVRFLGATETIAPYAQAYATYIFLAAPFIMCSFAMNNLFRLQGLATYGMVGMASGGILNMLLDPILIFGLGLGISGAAIATAISQVVSFVILLVMTNIREDTIHIRFRDYRPTASLYGRMLSNGFPSLGRQGIASISTIVLNNVAGAWGDPAIAAMSIVTRYTMFINASVIGFGQGFQPVCAFCYGAGRYSRVREAYRFSVKVVTVILVVLAGVSLLFARPIVTVFRPEDQDVIRIGTLALQLQLAAMPLWGLTVISSMFTQAIGDGLRSTIISIARQGIFLIPALLILPPLYELLGLQMAQPLSDVFSFGLSLVLSEQLLKQMKKLPEPQR